MAARVPVPSILQWLEALLGERFGVQFELVRQGEFVRAYLKEAPTAGILIRTIPELYFPKKLVEPCINWNVASEGFHSALGSPVPAPAAVTLATPLIESDGPEYYIHYDILGLAYWMLSRQEEVVSTELDGHARFPATSSHAFRQGYLERPVVDEWFHILGQVIKKVWPGMKLKQHRFSINVSHDVDSPSRYAFRTMPGLLRAMVGDVLKHGELKNALMAPWLRLTSRTALPPNDPANTFDWIMNLSERHGLTSAFYFICGRTNPAMDADYEIEHPAIRDLMRQIHSRGHEIGLHPSYNTYQDLNGIAAEAQRLRRVAKEEGIDQNTWGGRMHYLRWEQPTTLRAWERAGMSYDSTLGYADRPGFRCGTCFEYPAIDPVERQMLNLRIRPLIAMDVTVTRHDYLGYGVSDAAFEKIDKLKRTCADVKGVFTLLWHNSNLSTTGERWLYERLICE